MQESRHSIKTRMLKNAARAWGYSETEAESNFDPLVSMLLSACSTELEKISGEIEASRGRIIERVVQLLSPDVLTAALPAHAVACAIPAENSTDLPADSQLYTIPKTSFASDSDASVNKEFFFSPTNSFCLNKASIRFMATGGQLSKITNRISKEVIAYSSAGKELPESTLWLGIDEPGLSLENTMFYFDLRNEAESRLFYHQLPKASWHYDGHQLQHLPGYGNREISGENLDLESITRCDYNVSGKIKTHINAFYKPFFVTLTDKDGLTAKNEISYVVPSLITNTFGAKVSDQLRQQALRWICVHFPETIPNRLLQDLVCIMNCFPVMNQRLHQLSYRLQEMVNIIPLHSEDLFLDLENVCDDEGQQLNIDCFNKENEESFSMLMRNGGVGRFDQRDAASIVDYLLQLLRDESSAFSALGNDFMNSELKQLQQVMNKLEQRLFSRQLHTGQIPYLVIRNNKKLNWHNLLIRYWSTNGVEGNNIKAGTNLQLYKGGALNNNQALLVTTTQGGRNKLSTTETVLAYKSAVLSKDRIITNEDIKAFCHYQLGERVKKIEVRKGVMIHPDPKQGFSKTIDVTIEIIKKSYDEMLEKGELVFWTDNLKVLLEEKSTALMPYRIFIQLAA
jgi:hypothetical protein